MEQHRWSSPRSMLRHLSSSHSSHLTNEHRREASYTRQACHRHTSMHCQLAASPISALTAAATTLVVFSTERPMPARRSCQLPPSYIPSLQLTLVSVSTITRIAIYHQLTPYAHGR